MYRCFRPQILNGLPNHRQMTFVRRLVLQKAYCRLHHRYNLLNPQHLLYMILSAEDKRISPCPLVFIHLGLLKEQNIQTKVII